MTSTNGIPDLLAIKDGRTVFLEVKQPGKKPEPLQEYMINELKKHGVEAYVISNLNEIKTL